jgi:hypothetical protein
MPSLGYAGEDRRRDKQKCRPYTLLLLPLTLPRERCLAAAEPQTQYTPSGRQRRGDKGNASEPKPEPRQQRIRPRPNLILYAINKSVDEALRFVFVFAPQGGEQ